MRAPICDPLPEGTKVKVGNQIGIVAKSEIVRAHPSGFVALNHISFTGKYKTLFGNQYTIEQYPKPKKPKPINYAFIELV